MQVLERTMASLNSQMEEMCRSDVVSRSREQHETAIRTLTQKHQSEMLDLNRQLTSLQSSLEEKSSLVDKLTAELHEFDNVKGMERVKQADVVNKLTQSLEDSQKQCRDLLNSSWFWRFCYRKFVLDCENHVQIQRWKSRRFKLNSNR